jgi:hypothetical protein
MMDEERLGILLRAMADLLEATQDLQAGLDWPKSEGEAQGAGALSGASGSSGGGYLKRHTAFGGGSGNRSTPFDALGPRLSIRLDAWGATAGAWRS